MRVTDRQTDSAMTIAVQHFKMQQYSDERMNTAVSVCGIVTVVDATLWSRVFNGSADVGLQLVIKIFNMLVSPLTNILAVSRVPAGYFDWEVKVSQWD